MFLADACSSALYRLGGRRGEKRPRGGQQQRGNSALRRTARGSARVFASRNNSVFLGNADSRKKSLCLEQDEKEKNGF